MKNGLGEYSSDLLAQAGPRLTAPIDVPNLLQTGRATFEVNRGLERDVGYFDDEEEEEYGSFDEEDEPVEGFRKRRGKEMKDFAYLNDISPVPFINSPEGIVVQDLFDDGAVKKIVIREGHGPVIPDNCKVFVHYVCATEGASVFDSTLAVERCRPVGIDLRAANVLPGFYLALKSMRPFEASKFMIRYDKAFGEVGCPPRIPPVTDVVCTIEIISIVGEEQLKSIKYMSADERNELPFPKILEHSNERKHEGNRLYSTNNFGRAVKTYYEGINALEDYPVLVADDHDKRQEILFALYNNLAQCFLKMEKWPQACVACKKGLTCGREGDPIASKIFYRFAIAKRNLGQPTHALDLINKALKRDPNNKSIKLEKNTILERVRNEKELSKNLMTRMGGGICGQTKPVKTKAPVASEDSFQKKYFDSGEEELERVEIKESAGMNLRDINNKDTTEILKLAELETSIKNPAKCNAEKNAKQKQLIDQDRNGGSDSEASLESAPNMNADLLPELTDYRPVLHADCDDTPGGDRKPRLSGLPTCGGGDEKMDRNSPSLLLESQEQQKKNWEEYRMRMLNDCEASVDKPATPSPLEASVVDKMAALDVVGREEVGRNEAVDDPLTFEWEEYRDRMLSGEENTPRPEKLNESDRTEVASRHVRDLRMSGGGGKMVMVDGNKCGMNKKYSLFDTVTLEKGKVKRFKKKRSSNVRGGKAELSSDDD